MLVGRVVVRMALLMSVLSSWLLAMPCGIVASWFLFVCSEWACLIMSCIAVLNDSSRFFGILTEVGCFGTPAGSTIPIGTRYR